MTDDKPHGTASVTHNRAFAPDADHARINADMTLTREQFDQWVRAVHKVQTEPRIIMTTPAIYRAMFPLDGPFPQSQISERFKEWLKAQKT